jgi:hypothetical protein
MTRLDPEVGGRFKIDGRYFRRGSLQWLPGEDTATARKAGSGEVLLQKHFSELTNGITNAAFNSMSELIDWIDSETLVPISYDGQYSEDYSTDYA